MGWRTLLEECGDALLDDGSKQLPFYFAIWRFDGEMWARRLGREGVTVAVGACSGVRRVFWGFTPLLQAGNWARPLPAVSASTVTRQSYSVYPIITAAAPSSSVHCNPGYTALKHSPCMVQFLTFLFLFVFCFYCSFFFCSLFSECWLPAVICLLLKKKSLLERSKSICFPFYLEIVLISNNWVVIWHIHVTESAICFTYSKESL